MRTFTKFAALAALAGVASMFAPSIGALDVTCIETTEVSSLPAGSTTLITPPGADVLGWTPECIIVQAGQTITWTQRDAIGHGAVSDVGGCFELPQMNILRGPATTSLTLDVFEDEESGTLVLGALESDGGVGVCTVPAGATSVVIPYHCSFHGPAMPGKIIVEL